MHAGVVVATCRSLGQTESCFGAFIVSYVVLYIVLYIVLFIVLNCCVYWFLYLFLLFLLLHQKVASDATLDGIGRSNAAAPSVKPKPPTNTTQQ